MPTVRINLPLLDFCIGLWVGKMPSKQTFKTSERQNTMYAYYVFAGSTAPIKNVKLSICHKNPGLVLWEWASNDPSIIWISFYQDSSSTERKNWPTTPCLQITDNNLTKSLVFLISAKFYVIEHGGYAPAAMSSQHISCFSFHTNWFLKWFMELDWEIYLKENEEVTIWIGLEDTNQPNFSRWLLQILFLKVGWRALPCWGQYCAECLWTQTLLLWNQRQCISHCGTPPKLTIPADNQPISLGIILCLGRGIVCFICSRIITL